MKFYYTFSKIHLPFPYTVECGHHTNNLRPNKRHITMMGFLVFFPCFYKHSNQDAITRCTTYVNNNGEIMLWPSSEL